MTKRLIKGLATTAATDRSGDVVDPTGATYTLPFPLLAGHDHSKIIGQVTALQAVEGGLMATAEIVPLGTTEAADETWRLIQAGVLNGLSIGFRPLDAEVLPAGVQFSRYELFELSVVAVPCNPQATIQAFDATAKSVPFNSTSGRRVQIDLSHRRFSGH